MDTNCKTERYYCCSQYTGQPQGITELQVKAQFSIWAVLAAPLIISGTLLRMSAETLAVYKNAEVIAVSQVSDKTTQQKNERSRIPIGSLRLIVRQRLQQRFCVVVLVGQPGSRRGEAGRW